MNEQSIDEIISQEAFKQVERLELGLKSTNTALVDNIKSVNILNSAIAKSKTYSELNKSANAAALAVEKLNKAQLLSQQQAEKLAGIQAKNAYDEERRATARAAATEKQIKKEEELAVEQAKRNKNVVSNSQEEIDAYNSTANGAREVTNALNDVNRAQGQLHNSATAVVADLQNENRALAQTNRSRREAAFLLEEERQNQARRNTALRLEVREANAVQGSLEQRRAALIRLNNVYDNQSPQERASAAGQRLQRIIAGLTEQVSGLEQATGRHQRNVGNYASGLSSAYGVLRQVANILPGVGIAGVIAFATEPIIEYVKNLEIFKRSTLDAAKDTAIASNEFKKAQEDVARLKVATQEYHEGLITGTQLVRIYNEGIGKTAGELQTVTEVETFYNSKAQDYITAMSLRAQANAALDTAIEKTTKAQQRAAEAPTFFDFVKASFAKLPELLNASLNLSARGGLGGVLTQVSTLASKAQQQAVKDLQRQADEATKVFEDLQRQSDAFNKKSGLNLDGNNKTGFDGSEFDAQKARVERTKNFAKEIVDTETNSLDERLQALEVYTNAAAELTQIEYDREVAKAKGNAVKIKFLTEQLQTDKEKVLIEGRKIEAKLNEDADKKLVELLKKGLKDYEETEKKKVEALKVSIAQQLTLLDEYYQGINVGLAEQFSKGLISQKQYENARLQVQRDALNGALNEQIAGVQRIIDIKKEAGLDTAADETALAELERKLSKETATQQITDLEKVAARRKELNDKGKELANEIANLGIALVNATFDNEKNRVQEQIDLNETRKSKEVDATAKSLEVEKAAINASLLTQEEKTSKIAELEESKANQIALIEARAASQRQQLELRQRQLDEQKAKFDKAVSIARIIANTAVGITAALTSIPPNIPLSIVIGAIGAAQVATVLATPIPKYEKGTNNSKGGLALTDEKGAEGYITPDGRAFLGNNTPTLRNLQAGTKIIPHKELVRRLGKPEMTRNMGGREIDPALISEQRNGTRQIVKAIKGQSRKSQIEIHDSHGENSRYIAKNF